MRSLVLKINMLSLALFLSSCADTAVKNQCLVSELDLSLVSQGWGAPGKNLSVDGKPIRINGREFKNGIGTHAVGAIQIALDGQASYFSTWMGVDDEVARKSASVVFKIKGDKKILFDSGTMRAGDEAKCAFVLLDGIRTLMLLTEDAGDGIAYDHADWAEPIIGYSKGEPKIMVNIPDLSEYILTPPPPKKPRLTGAKIFGVRPLKPFLFTITATGERPLTFFAQGLPNGLSLDANTGRITGVIKDGEQKTYKLTFGAKNKFGTAERDFKIVVGDNICLTPPIGWNSWYCYSEGISAAHVKAVADAFVASGLKDHGWSFVNIDDCWQGDRNSPNKALTGNERFPDMKAMCDYVHALGLKIGIYSTPWMGSYAGFRGGSTPRRDGTYDNILPEAERLQKSQVYGRWPTFEKQGANKVGSVWLCDVDAKQWAEWGFDYVKYDWKPNDAPTTRRILKGLEVCGRDIILSLSNAAPIANAPELSKLANLWRTGGDIHDSWGSISRCFNQEPWSEFASPGHFNDMDMLQVGMLGIPNRNNSKPRASRLTPDEQYLQVSMWCLQVNPLLLSCYIDLLDEFTISLLTNDEVLEVNQDPLCDVARRVYKKQDTEIWLKQMEDGRRIAGLINRSNKTTTIEANWATLDIEDAHIVRDLWRQRNLGTFKDAFTTEVPAHGVVLISLSKTQGE